MNILLVVVDTMRADHLSTYGYKLPTTPNLSDLAGQGVRFESCYAHANTTDPSFTTLFTGRHPLNHGIVGHMGTRKLSRRVPVLPETLRAKGFTTAAVDTLGSWFKRGFHTYRSFVYRFDRTTSHSGEEVNALALSLLDKLCQKRRPFFLFLHYWDPHTPYVPPHPFDQLFAPDSRQLQRDAASLDAVYAFAPLARYMREWIGDLPDISSVTSRYDGELAYVDACIGQLLERLDRLGVGDETLVVVTGDHGESLNEHHIYFDHRGLYEPSLRVPLLLRWPERLPAGRVVDGIARHIDLAPTLLDLAGLPGSMPCEGVSLGSRIEGSDEPVTDTVLSCESSWQSALALRVGEWKLIWQRPYQDSSTFELYDLAADPAEVHDLASERPDRVHQLATQLEQKVEVELTRGGHSVNPLRGEGPTLRSLYSKAETPEALREQVIELLQDQGKLPPDEAERYSSAEEALIQDRLRNLGYL